MADQAFDIPAARKAGYSDDEILSHLTQTRKFDVDGAMKSGYSKSDIIGHLASSPSTPEPESKPRGQIFWETSGGQTIQDLIGGASRDPKRAQKSVDTVKGLVRGIAAEPGRIWDQLVQSGDAMTKGNASGVAYHLAGAVPFIGPTAQEVGNDIEKGNYLDAAERTAGMLVPLVAGKLPGAVERAAPIVKGAAQGGYAAATEMVPISRHGVEISVPKPIVTGAAGAAVSRLAGLPATPGAIVGGAAPIVKGIVKGAREAMGPAPRIHPVGGHFPEGYAPVEAAPQILEQPQGGHFPEGYKPATAATEAAPPVVQSSATPGQILAKSSGQDWAKLSAGDRAILEQVAKDQQNVAAQPARPPMGPTETPAPPAEVLPQYKETQYQYPYPDSDYVTPHGPYRIPPEPAQVTPTSMEPTAPPTPPAQKPWAEMTKPELYEALGLPTDATTQQFTQAFHKELTSSGTAPSAVAEIDTVPDPTALAEMARQVPQRMRKEVAKANYRAVKEGNAAKNTASPTYEATNRMVKVEPVAKAILDNGITYSDMTKLTKAEIESLVNQLSAATARETGEHPGNVFSKLSIDELLGELRRAESAAKGAKR